MEVPLIDAKSQWAPADTDCDPLMAAIQVGAQNNSHQNRTAVAIAWIPSGIYVSPIFVYRSTDYIVVNYDLIKPAGRLSFFLIFARTFQMLPLRLGSVIGNACKGEQ